ncbi:MAG: hypothetical protein V3T14_01745, partial [Myxococcota bacterium]
MPVRAEVAVLIAAALLSLSETGCAKPDPLLEAVDRVMAKIRSRELRSDEVTPWVIMHGVIAFEAELRVHDSERKVDMDAIEFLLTRAKHQGSPIFRDVGGAPVLPPRRRYFQVQDHVDQVLMALADAGVGLERELISHSGRRFKVLDLLSAGLRSFKEDQELGWTLVALSTYVPFDQEWSDLGGRRYRTEDVVRLALSRNPRRETEGGTHHLYGLAYALRQYQQHRNGGTSQKGTPLPGPWREAETYLESYAELAREYQREDGAFSAAVFRGPAEPSSPKGLVSTTGHMLEWLMV